MITVQNKCLQNPFCLVYNKKTAFMDWLVDKNTNVSRSYSLKVSGDGAP